MSTRFCDVYAERLFPVGRGHPLWVPGRELSTGREVLVGDVGFLRQGLFTPLFNTTKPADDPINLHGAPPDFRMVFPGDIFISRSQKLPRGIVCSAGMSAVEIEGGVPTVRGIGRSPSLASAWKLRCTTDAGAFVALDSPGVAEDIESSRPYIVNYMREYLDSWLQFANATNGLGIDDHDISFVCGTVKTTRWGVGAIQFEGTACDMERRPSGALQVYSLAPLDSLEFDDQTFLRCSHGTGPSLPSTGPRDAPTACNQCLFIHYYKMKRRQSGLGGDWGQRGTMVGAGGYEIGPEDPSCDEPGYDPVGPLLDNILKNSEAAVAIASDIDVTTFFRGETFPKSEDMTNAIARLSPAIEVDQHGVGNISL